MAIKQTIEFKSDNKYFAGFLQNLIDENKMNASVSISGKKIELLIDETDISKLQTFGDASNKYLPNSIFLGHIQTDHVDEKIQQNKIDSPSYNIAPCPKCLESITNPASADYLNDNYQCRHYTNEANKNIDYSSYSVHYTQGMTLLLTDSTKASDLFYLSELEAKALFSIEKPSIKLTIKDERLKEVAGGNNFIYVRAPHSIKSNLVALNAFDSEIDYLFFDENDNKKCVIVKDNISFVRDNAITKNLEEFHNEKVFNRVLNIEKEAGFKGSITANMSMIDGFSFIVSNEIGIKKVLEFQSFDIKQFLVDMQEDKLKSKMFVNFSKKYPHVIENLQNKQEFNIFELLCEILEIENQSFSGLSDKAYEFRGNGGLKIDMYFKESGFDYISFFGSIMSFKLAGSETHFLSYSIFEAFGDMIISTCNQLKTQFTIDNFIMMGDMFENSVLYSRILNKFQLSNPYFSMNIALDEAMEI